MLNLPIDNTQDKEKATVREKLARCFTDLSLEIDQRLGAGAALVVRDRDIGTESQDKRLRAELKNAKVTIKDLEEKNGSLVRIGDRARRDKGKAQNELEELWAALTPDVAVKPERDDDGQIVPTVASSASASLISGTEPEQEIDVIGDSTQATARLSAAPDGGSRPESFVRGRIEPVAFRDPHVERSRPLPDPDRPPMSMPNAIEQVETVDQSIQTELDGSAQSLHSLEARLDAANAEIIELHRTAEAREAATERRYLEYKDAVEKDTIDRNMFRRSEEASRARANATHAQEIQNLKSKIENLIVEREELEQTGNRTKAALEQALIDIAKVQSDLETATATLTERRATPDSRALNMEGDPEPLSAKIGGGEAELVNLHPYSKNCPRRCYHVDFEYAIKRQLDGLSIIHKEPQPNREVKIDHRARDKICLRLRQLAECLNTSDRAENMERNEIVMGISGLHKCPSQVVSSYARTAVQLYDGSRRFNNADAIFSRQLHQFLDQSILAVRQRLLLHCKQAFLPPPSPRDPRLPRFVRDMSYYRQEFASFPPTVGPRDLSYYGDIDFLLAPKPKDLPNARASMDEEDDVCQAHEKIARAVEAQMNRGMTKSELGRVAVIVRPRLVDRCWDFTLDPDSPVRAVYQFLHSLEDRGCSRGIWDYRLVDWFMAHVAELPEYLANLVVYGTYTLAAYDWFCDKMAKYDDDGEVSDANTVWLKLPCLVFMKSVQYHPVIMDEKAGYLLPKKGKKTVRVGNTSP